MDKPRKSAKRNRMIRRGVFITVAIVAGVTVTVALSRLEPAPPSVKSDALMIDTVKRGEMLRRVRGTGTLVPVVVWWIPASTEGRVERVLVEAGNRVEIDTILLVLSNPELELSAFDAESQVKSTLAELAALKIRLEKEQLDLEAGVASVEKEFKEAKLRHKINVELADEGTVSDLELQLTKLRSEELEKLMGIQIQRFNVSERLLTAEIEAQMAKLDQVQARARLLQRQFDALKVRSGKAGILEQLPVEVGQWVTPGTTLAKVTDPTDLKAVVRIPETQAREVQIGLKALIDTRNGIIEGFVKRIDPAVEAGTVSVDVALEGELPRGARPDLTIDGTIEIERLDEVLYVGRPVFGQANATISLFRIDPETGMALRIPVRLGRTSVSTIEVLSGLEEGDRIILSDTTQWDDYDRIRLK